MAQLRRVAPFVAVLALVACGSDDDARPEDTTTEPTESAPAPATDATASPDTTAAVTEVSTLPTDATSPSSSPETGDDDVEVLDAGAEPRSELRFALEEGTTSEFTMTMAIGLDMEADGASVPVPDLPPLLIGGSISIDSVDGDLVTYTFSFDDLGVVADGLDPEEVETYEDLFTELEGVSGTAQINSRGETLSSEIDTAGVEDPALLSQLEQFSSQIESLTIPFPDDAVGVGAEWVATREATLNGMTTIARTSYRLVELGAEGYTIDLTQTQEGRPGPIDLPTLPAGAEAELVSSTAESSGQMVGRFDRVMPNGSLDLTGDIVMTMTMGGQTQDVDQSIEIEVVVEST